MDDTATINVNASWRTRFACNQDIENITPECGNGIIEGGETCERAYAPIGDYTAVNPIADATACEALGGTAEIGNTQCLLPFDDNVCNEPGNTDGAPACTVKTDIDSEPNPERPDRTVPNGGDIILAPSAKLII